MQKIIYSGTIVALTLLAAVVLIRSENVRSANATPIMVGQATDIVDIRALESKIDIAALPRFDLNHMD